MLLQETQARDVRGPFGAGKGRHLGDNALGRHVPLPADDFLKLIPRCRDVGCPCIDLAKHLPRAVLLCERMLVLGERARKLLQAGMDVPASGTIDAASSRAPISVRNSLSPLKVSPPGRITASSTILIAGDAAVDVL